MRVLLMSLLLFSCAQVLAAEEWGPIKSGPLGNTVEFFAAGKQVGLVWPYRATLGEDLLLSKSTYKRYEINFFHRYRFVGVSGNTLRIEASGASQEKGQRSAKSDRSFDRVLLIERNSDGDFYFAPDEIKDEGVFRISGPLERSSSYEVSLKRTKK